jgi:MoaA/NifB/PqqE/SkfB family radical SAM enzyme
MESIYYSICWHCHRKCKHCYEDDFRPYIRDALDSVVSQASANMPKIVDNLPSRMAYRDADDPQVEHIGRIVLSGGEVLTDAVREPVLYPLLERLRDKYRHVGGVKVIIQTTGDLLTPAIIDELLAREIWMISISGMDDYHVGMEGDKRVPLIDRLIDWFHEAGIRDSELASTERNWMDAPGPLYSFFGATEDAWIGKLWPRGRAWSNSLTHATMDDNFCDAWSGGKGFLNHEEAGSEVSIDADGNVYPCCLKTAHPLGNLTEEPLTDILDSLSDHPSLQAINRGQPDEMGVEHGWTAEQFREASHTIRPDGEPYANLCIGCDRFHAQVLGPILEDQRNLRRARRGGQLDMQTATG